MVADVALLLRHPLVVFVCRGGLLPDEWIESSLSTRLICGRSRLDSPQVAGSIGRQLSVDEMELGLWHDGPRDLKLPYLCEKPQFSQGSSCPSGWMLYHESCYSYRKECASYADAADQCDLNGGNLVTITDKYENNFALEACLHRECWIGLHKPALGVWRWHDKSELNWTNWAPDEPDLIGNFNGKNEDRAFIGSTSYQLSRAEPSPCEVRTHDKRRDFFFWFLINTVIVLSTWSFACIYNRRVTRNRPPFPAIAQLGHLSMQNHPNFHYDLFECTQDWCTTCHAFCCQPVRAGDTFAGAGVSNFWIPLIVWTIALFIPMEHSGWFMAAFMSFRRTWLRVKLGGRAEGYWCASFFTWWFCGPCAAAQEARQVDSAQGVTVTCCCDLTQCPCATLVGPAAEVIGLLPLEPPNDFVLPGQVPIAAKSSKLLNYTPVVVMGFQPGSHQADGVVKPK